MGLQVPGQPELFENFPKLLVAVATVQPPLLQFRLAIISNSEVRVIQVSGLWADVHYWFMSRQRPAMPNLF
jgi:hypothetical protein